MKNLLHLIPTELSFAFLFETLLVTSKGNGMAKHGDYIYQLVHALACIMELWSTREVWREQNKRETCSRQKAENNSSFLTTLPTP